MNDSKNIKVLMFGWEFPPFNSGGLGVACQGLTRGLTRQGVEVIFVLPRIAGTLDEEYMRILTANKFGVNKHRIKFKTVDSILKPYISSESYLSEKSGLERFLQEAESIYGSDLFSEVQRYSKYAKIFASEEDFDVIHCHDWLTYPAGIAAKSIAKNRGMNVPLIVHVHATEFDRTGGHPNQYVYDLERNGMHVADYIITVSNYTKNIVVKHYGVDPSKIHVIHNSIDFKERKIDEKFRIKDHYKVVLFLGRMTIQKGPDHFLWIAKKISEMDDDVRFIMVGSGDMFPYIVEEAANLGIGDKVLFSDFLNGRDVDRAYKMADVYVMSSISEPFGITPLEAINNGTPAVISKQSGVSEILRNCIVVDFWDINLMATKILSLLNDTELRNSLVEKAMNEIRDFSWDQPARKCIDLYKKAISEGV
ncbi:MAG TPA: glycosyltransferase family 1 protein [Candidatus Altiarchaeales archaeon]|nr:glycosyltransferase family 1 protein [Candidatus Altiarchaeales archaeon]